MNQTELIKCTIDNNVEIVDFKFCDFMGHGTIFQLRFHA